MNFHIRLSSFLRRFGRTQSGLHLDHTRVNSAIGLDPIMNDSLGRQIGHQCPKGNGHQKQRFKTFVNGQVKEDADHAPHGHHLPGQRSKTGQLKKLRDTFHAWITFSGTHGHQSLTFLHLITRLHP